MDRLTKEGREVIYSGGEQRQAGVGLSWYHTKLRKQSVKYDLEGDRIITMKLVVKPDTN